MAKMLNGGRDGSLLVNMLDSGSRCPGLTLSESTAVPLSTQKYKILGTCKINSQGHLTTEILTDGEVARNHFENIKPAFYNRSDFCHDCLSHPKMC